MATPLAPGAAEGLPEAVVRSVSGLVLEAAEEAAAAAGAAADAAADAVVLSDDSDFFFFRGARYVEISLDGAFIFKGEIQKAPGATLGERAARVAPAALAVAHAVGLARSWQTGAWAAEDAPT